MKRKAPVTLIRMAPLGLILGGCCGAGNVVTLDASSHGRTVTVPLSGTLFVALPANPTTGFSWEIDSADASVLESKGAIYTPDSPMLVGSGGTETWEFIVLQAGTTTLRLIYRRPFEPEDIEPADVFEVTVTVQ